MIDGQPEGAAREASLWARAWAWWKAWRRPRKHFFVNSFVTVGLGLMFMLDIRLIAGLLIIAAIIDADTFLAGQDRAKGEAKIPFWLTLKPLFYLFCILALAIPFVGQPFRDACLPADSVWAEMFGLARSKIENVGGLCAYPYSTYTFFVESMVHMLLIIGFYFANFVIQRNIYAMYFWVNMDEQIKIVKKSEQKKTYIDPVVLIFIGSSFIYIGYDSIDYVGRFRVGAPYLNNYAFFNYFFVYFSVIFFIFIYFRTYAYWRMP